MEKTFDTVILGGGPAGIAAAIYTARSQNSCAIIDTCALGGQPSNYLELDNYPGFSRIGGFDLMEKFENHMNLYNVEKFQMQEIEMVDLQAFPKIIKTSEHTFYAKSVIIATGAKPKKLGVEGELDLIGRGVSYCAVCDGGFYKDKIVTVVGGGNSALEEAVYLTKFAKHVYLVHRRNEFRADKIVQEKFNACPKTSLIGDSIVEKIIGDKKVNALQIKNLKTNENKILETDGIFPYIGIIPNVEFIKGQLNQDANGFIITDVTMQTSIPGVFAVGDVRNTPLRQVITATSDGAVAAVYATKYVENLKFATQNS